MNKAHKQLEISLPQAIDLGFCPINTSIEKVFSIINYNDYPVKYSFKQQTFQVTPSNGTINPSQKINHYIKYCPKQAVVLVATIVFEAQKQQSRIFKISLIGKWAYLSLSTDKINFEGVLIGSTSNKPLILKNTSSVVGVFKIFKIQDDILKDPAFTLSTYESQIPANAKFQIRIFYNPTIANFQSISRFKIVCQGGNQAIFTCEGKCLPINVYLSEKIINFGEIKIDSKTNHALNIHNSSTKSTHFQFFSDNGNIFNFSQLIGTVPANSYKRIIIQFIPKNTMCYYQRVYCIVRNHIILYVDLIGTCYDLLIKPIPIMPRHIHIFRNRVIAGRISQVDLRYMQNSILLKMQKMSEQNWIPKNPQEEQLYNFSQSSVALHKELFQQASSSNKLIELSDDYVEFGFNEIYTLSSSKQIIVKNNMACKLTIFWINKKKQTANGNYEIVFNIFPQTAQIKANSTHKFHLTFKPIKSSNYFFQFLQFFAIKFNPKLTKKVVQQFEKKQSSFKPQNTVRKNIKLSQTLRSKVYNQIQYSEMIPPISGYLKVMGHSFSNNSMTFIPMIDLNPNNKIHFIPCGIRQSVYETVQLVNKADTSCFFHIMDDVNKVFRVFPNCGLIEGKSFFIVTCQFNPKNHQFYHSQLPIQLNSVHSKLILHLYGLCSQAKIQIENEGRIYFSPSFLGVYSKQEIKVHNTSRLQIMCNINVPQKYKLQVIVEPMWNMINPNETYAFTVYFIPLHKKKYRVKIPVLIKQIRKNEQNQNGYWRPGSMNDETKDFGEKQYFIQLIGEGGDGALQLNQEVLNFDVVKISEHKKLNCILKNPSKSTFFVEMQFKPRQSVNYNKTIRFINNSFHLDFKSGIIASHSQISIDIIFAPNDVFEFNIDLVAVAKQHKPPALKTTKIDPVFKCSLNILAKGRFPLLKIIDIRNDNMSVAALWQNFQIRKINLQLSCNLNEDEKKFLQIQTLPFHQAQLLQSKLKEFQWNFGYLPSKQNVKPRKIIITVQNFGGTSLDYYFKFPSDNKIEEQPWADPGEPKQEQAYEKAILAKNIFQIKPRKKHMKSGQIQDIELIYTPVNISKDDIFLKKKKKDSNNQSHFLKVVLQIMNGKPLVINLTGMSLGPSEGLLAVKKNNYIFPQTPIGILSSIKIPIQIHNVGSSKINYQVQISEQNYQTNNEVFTIKNPNGYLPPSEKQYLHCMFKPFQAKIYNFKIKINVFDFVKKTHQVILNIEGQGIYKDKHDKSKKQQQENNQVSSIPGQRNLVSQIGSKVFFSVEEIDFGILYPEVTTYRMVILYNLSKSESLYFQFNTISTSLTSKNGLCCGDILNIEPINGDIQPLKWIQLKIYLTGARQPSVYEGQIQCMIMWGTKKCNQI